ncbi:MAG: LysM peptidoglycan-binding domain-containing protein [Gemmatimonadota bacterium]
MRLVTAALIGLLAAMPLLAQEPLREREHVVRKGDTLWDLAGFYLSDPFRWPTIYEANPAVVEDPHWIYPEEVLVIPGLRGEPEPRPGFGLQPSRAAARTVFYRPESVRPRQQEGQPTVLAEPEFERLPVRPGEFSSAPYLEDPAALDVRAEFVRAIRDDRRTAGAATSAHPQDRVFLRYVRGGARPEVGQHLALVEIGDEVDGARGTRIIEPRGIVRIMELAPDVVVAQIEAQYGPVTPDQLVIPMDMFPDFRAEAPEPVEGGSDLRGQILAFARERPIHTVADLAFLDLGARDGVGVGDVFEAYLPERTVRERQPGEFRARAQHLPAEPVAYLRVVRVTDGYATAKVDEMVLPRLQQDLPVRRVRRMP